MTTVNIGTASELVAFAARVNAGETTLDAKLTADIDLSGVTWTPIGTSTYKYAGTFDGNGRTISNIANQFSYSSGNAVFKNTYFSLNTLPNNIRLMIGGNLEYCVLDGNNNIFYGAGNRDSNYQLLSSIYGIHNCIFINIYMQRATDLSLIETSGSTVIVDYCLFKNICLYANIQYYGNTQCRLTRYQITSEIIAIDGYRNGLSGAPENNFGRITSSVLSNTGLYASDTITSNILSYGVGSTTDYNGLTVSSTLYNQKSFYDGTGIGGTIYLSWDFTNTWYWDDEENLPKLQVFRPTVLKIYNGSEWVNGTPYIYTSMGWVKNGDIVGGYNAVYCSDQTNYPFNDGNGNITVTDGTDYYWYNTTTGTTTLISASGVTWDVINTLGSDGYVQSDGVDDRIYTGYAPQNSYFKLEFSMTPVTLKSSGNYFYCGTGGSWLSFEYTSSSGAYWNAGSTTIFGSHSMGTGNTYTYSIVYQNGIFSSSGSYSYSRTYSGSITCTDFVFFSGTVGSYSSEKLYYLKMYSSSDTLVRDYIPIIYGSTYALYDRVENKIYNNAGTGSFSGGGTPTPLVVGARTVTLKKYIYTSNGWKEF